MIKVFSMNDCDWMAGESLEACKAEYLKYYTSDGEGAFDDPHEVPADRMAKMQFVEEDGGKRSFQAELDRLVASGATFPRFFASTEY